jgi:hypothetical protein
MDKVRASTRGNLDNAADQASWRVRMRPDYIKFCDKRKTQFLEELLKHGQRSLACQVVDVTLMTLRTHLKNDPDFAAAFDETLALRSQLIVEQLEREALVGHTQPIFDKDGNEVGEKRVYETQLRLAMLKRFDPEYKDRAEIEHKGGGGVLIAPPDATPQEWISREQAKNEERTKPGEAAHGD